ncbi:putative histone acetyltransferase chromatin regulator PHD family [Helianthus annuus]|nr:putative histone acetyltransferase chromatin regulator PHD family [Helianthus annuus]KAJ0866730.1 putative histone acetyltransferase chromatin regulator PHD family [Helianthus annuus]
MEQQHSGNSSVPGTSGRSIALEIDLNEAPLPSPREFAGAGGFPPERRCMSCGEVEGSMVICFDCGKRSHIECLGVRKVQRGWKCFECLTEYRNGKRIRLAAAPVPFDINESPPRELDCAEEGYFVNSELVLAASFPKMQDLMRNPFLGFALNSPMSHPDMRFIATGSPSQNTSCSMPRFAHVNLETATRKGNLIYLQALKDYITEKQGVLGDGWRVKFEYSETNCKTSAIYFAPDGTRFDSMSQVAHHLGLTSTFNSSETEDKGNGFVLIQKGSHSSKRKKDKRANNREHKNTLRNGKNSIEADSFSNGSKLFHDGFPVQFEDFFVMSVGKIDPRGSFHNASQIWPVGYRSIWHDKFTGSIFVYDVLDGGDSGPIFRVHRYPCTKQSIPYASKVLCVRKCEPIHDDYDDDDTNIHMMFTELTPPPHLDNDNITSLLTADPTINLEEREVITGNHDLIGEFSIEDVSSSSAWKKAVETLLHACHESYNKKKVLTFCCNHRVNEQCLDASYDFSTLGKFCYVTGPLNSIPDKILTVTELESSCEALRKWLELDRFGLDAEFVQELIEQLPGVAACAKYESLMTRINGLRSQTVGSGFFMAISKDGLQNEAVSNSLRQTNKRPSPPGNKVNSNLPPHLIGDVIQAYEICLRFYKVLGLEAPISRQVMESELMNPWVDDLKPVKWSSVDFQKNLILKTLENTRPNDVTFNAGEDSVEHEREGSRAEAASKCAGVELAKFHMALLKVVIEDVLVKVKEIYDPFGGVESKSRKGRKKDAEVVVGGKRISLDMLPVNEFTWPEVARRYILVALSVDGNFESSEVMTRECGKVFHCLHGDGGTLCGSLTGVAAMEADAMVLAEASKKIFSSVNSKAVEFIIDQKEIDTGDSAKEMNVIDDDSPEWAQALEPVRKLPTNVGARIRRCIYESLSKNPPDWAKKILEHSISKEVYKGNASGPTKRAVISVLEKVRVDIPQPKPAEKKEKEKSGVRTLSDAVMKRCRVVLRSVAAADEDRVFFNLLARPVLKPNDPDDTGVLGYPAMVSRPLDFRTIDLRLAAGFYVTSHESFIEDVREVWQNLRIAYRDIPDYIELVETLSKKFEELYEEEVLNLVSRITCNGNSFDSSTEEAKKELNSLVIEITEGPLPPAPWEDGVCKVCGMDKDDDSVLLCDKCDSEYHTYCLVPPLARIPDGNWYCPSCMSSQPIVQDERCGTRALSRLRGKKKFQKEFTRNLLEKLAPLADTMELMEYWELGTEERVFLFKFLCDESLSSGVVRNDLGSDSGDLEKQLRKLYKELKTQNKKEEVMASNSAKEVEDKCQEEENLSFSKSSDGQSQIQNEENDGDQDQESIQEKITNLESKKAKPVIRREFLGRDLVGRLYWAVSSPERVLVSGPHGRMKACEMPEMYTSDDSLWTCYESDSEIQELIGWLRDDDAREKDLKETITHWQSNRVNIDNTLQTVQGNCSTSSGYDTKARAILEKKFGLFLKKHCRKGKSVNNGNWYRCECLELVGSTRHHCSSCHLTYSTNEELEGHNNGKCGNHQETEQPAKSKKVSIVKHAALPDHHDEPKSDCPFNFEEIRAKFCTRGSLKDEVKDIGLIGSNGVPSLIWFNPNDGPTEFPLSEKQSISETPSKVERSKPKGIGGKSSLKTRTPVRICQSSLKPLAGRVLEILRHLKIILFDMESALPNEAIRPSRGGLDRLRAWRAFVKSAQSIYEMVQATIIFEEMIKTEYFRKEWWYWSSPATAAKISNISALALRIYALDAAIYYEMPATSNLDPTDPVTPKAEKKSTEKSNTKEVSEKSNPKNSQRASSSPATDSKPPEASRPKTRSKKKSRDSDS